MISGSRLKPKKLDGLSRSSSIKCDTTILTRNSFASFSSVFYFVTLFITNIAVVRSADETTTIEPPASKNLKIPKIPDSVFEALCFDYRDNCKVMAQVEGECTKLWMQSHCPVSCNRCGQVIKLVPAEETFNPLQSREKSIITPAVRGGTELTGKPQVIPPGADMYDVLKLIKKTKKYIDKIHSEEKYSVVRHICINKRDLCLSNALEGKCYDNDGSVNELMSENCGPICQTCEKFHVALRCPLPHINEVRNAWYPGDLNRMFEKIVNDPVLNRKYNVTILSRPHPDDIEEISMKDIMAGDEDDDEDEDNDDNEEESAIDKTSEEYVTMRMRKLLKNNKGGPWVLTIDNFINETECNRLIELGAKLGYDRSMDVGDEEEETGEFSAVVSADRTSTNAWCNKELCYEDPMVISIQDRMHNLTGISMDNSEYFQLLRYEKGQFYKEHHDCIDEEADRSQGVRILTIFLYLNDVSEGGGTNFPVLNLTVQPVRGRAVLWPSVLDQKPHTPDQRTTHQSLQVIGENTIKYGANVWIHQRPLTDNCI